MRRTSTARLVFASLGLALAAAASLGHRQIASAQLPPWNHPPPWNHSPLSDHPPLPPPPPSPPPNLFWEHPFGDATTIPCTHITQQHPQGHATTIPCIHRTQQHPEGDTGARVPCVHWNNFRQQHSSDPVIVPCIHIVAQHPNGDAGPIGPCTHLTQQHPGGHPGPTGPCHHPLPVQRTEPSLGLVFFTDDSALQNEVITSVRKLQTLGGNVGRPRPLNVFNRPPINGNLNDNHDPFWSHYQQLSHSIQLMRGRPLDDLITVIHHELGHALVGHSCVITVNSGGPHSIEDANNGAVGISEGWANFVALAVERKPSDASVMLGDKKWDWENAGSKTNSSIPFDKKNEFRAAAILWDLFDSHAEKGDEVSLSFPELFKVWSPTLKTLPNGPVLADVIDFVTRLKRNNPDKDTQTKIDAIVSLNLTPP